MNLLSKYSTMYLRNALIDSKISLIFSNCLLFNKGSNSKGIRKMALDLKAKFEKLLAKAKCANQSQDDEDIPMEVWKQCDRCMKWRRIEVVGKQPYRWKCGDDGTPYFCDMPEVCFISVSHP